MADIQSAQNIFILGIKGVAMAQIASILKKMGKIVSGFDTNEEFITDDELRKQSIQIYTKAEDIPSSFDLALYSAAHGGINNPIMKSLEEKGVTAVSQAEFLSSFSELFEKTIAVCGAHGKTTTSSLLSFCLLELHEEPTYIVGTSSFDSYPAGDYRSNKYLVLEADEYAVNPPHDKTPKFHFLKPSLTLCTNIDFDHPDVFDSLEEVKKAYETFFKQSEYVVYCADDESTVEAVLRAGVTVDSYGFSEAAQHRIINHEVTSSGSTFDLIYGDRLIEDIHISLYGDHNILNAAGVFLTLFKLGFSQERIKKVIAGFKGAKRRFDVVYEKNGHTIVDDYAHHPAEIKAFIKAVNARYGKKPVIIFQPHTFSRTETLLPEFGEAFREAGYTFILPIFASARENVQSFTVTSADIVAEARQRGNGSIEYCATPEELMKNLKSLPEKSVIATVGAGDVYKLKSDIMRVLES